MKTDYVETTYQAEPVKIEGYIKRKSKKYDVHWGMPDGTDVVIYRDRINKITTKNQEKHNRPTIEPGTLLKGKYSGNIIKFVKWGKSENMWFHGVVVKTKDKGLIGTQYKYFNIHYFDPIH